MMWNWFKNIFELLGCPLNETLEVFGLSIPSVDIFALACYTLIVLVLASGVLLLLKRLWFR